MHADNAQFAIYAAYRNRLETAFLADQLASAIATASEGVPSAASQPGSPHRAASAAASPSQAPSLHTASPRSSSVLSLPSLPGDGGTPSKACEEAAEQPLMGAAAVPSSADVLGGGLDAVKAAAHAEGAAQQPEDAHQGSTGRHA
jgi:hypothetical protein